MRGIFKHVYLSSVQRVIRRESLQGDGQAELTRVQSVIYPYGQPLDEEASATKNIVPPQKDTKLLLYDHEPYREANERFATVALVLLLLAADVVKGEEQVVSLR